MEGLDNKEMDVIIKENDRLVLENTELRKLVGLLQKNVELRNILEKTGRRIDESSIRSRKDSSASKEDKEDSSLSKELKSTEEGGNGNGGAGMHTPQNSQQLHRMQRIIGEIAFQLDRRILASIFQDRVRLYGITVTNILQKITETCTEDKSGQLDEAKKSELMKKYQEVMEKLKKHGYEPKIHPTFAEYIVNVYGIIKEYPIPGSIDLQHLLDPVNLKKIANSTVPASDLKDVLILLECLSNLSKEDGKPVFVW
ncbi:hypothetical protein FKM82_005741 [Ascaphus truei]|uniref:speriolin-like protein n=1 Tax=Ascaphus truei TaxID=8439 RepID=UPI003F59F292